MLASKRCLQASFQALKSSRRIASRRFPSVRTYAQAALREDPSPVYQAEPFGAGSHAQGLPGVAQWRDEYSPQPLAKHMNQLFSPLKFPPELAHRILTHGSHQTARYHGHNSGHMFMGRRVMESYLLMFLHASSNLKPSHDLETIVARTLNSSLLGEHVGTAWGYGKVLQWTPAVTRKDLEELQNIEKTRKRIGFNKVQGDAVVATLGGVFQQFGASVAQRLFHTRVLPRLLVRGGLPTEFHEEVLALQARMGGENANLSGNSPA
ncbi:hypothetical protein BKA70DRAFT_1562297 [Coprinopsis sp. MPI-PUGE-AT-0042]|nr:hypothetical protein BKA70DRAFT_1562297 [Coprinopsis sp. MPI-PUGE-AT-0042]